MEDPQPTNKAEQEGSTVPPIPPEQRLHVVVYIDNFNLTPFNRNRVLRALRTFLREQLGPEDQVMLVSYDRSLHLRHPFTKNRQQINRALLELEDLSAQRIHRNGERQELISTVVDDEEGYDMALFRLRAYAGSVRNDMNFTIDALASVVDGLAGAPGRKAIVYVSDGIPMIASEDVFHLVKQKYENALSLNEMTEYDLSRRFQELAAKANANRVSFYTIDARGLTVLSQGSVDAATAGSPGQHALIDSIWLHNLQSPLHMMAEKTGGRAILNTNRVLPDLLKMASDFNNYYSLGYAPTSQGDGRYHQIEVRLKERQKGVRVRHRTGYRNKSIEQRMIDGMFSALNLDLQSNPLEARIVFGPPKRRSEGTFDTPIYLQLPFSKLTLIERDGTYQGKLRLWLAAKDEKDRSTEAQETAVDIRIPSDRIGDTVGKIYTYRIKLVMESGYHDVAIGVRDEFGGHSAFLRSGIDVGAR